jgi:hypothetical protein
VQHVKPAFPPHPQNDRDSRLYVLLSDAQSAQRIAQAMEDGVQEFNFRGDWINPRCFMANKQLEFI